MTEAVCISETAAPTAMAYVRRAPAPTRYAAVMVLPCPGPNACTAPNPKARRSEAARTNGVRRHRTRPANEPPDAMGAPPTVAPSVRDSAPRAVPRPGRKENTADVTSRGLE